MILSACSCMPSIWRRRWEWGPHTISVPRIRPADDINPEDFSNAISDDIFAKIVTCTSHCGSLYRNDCFNP